MEEQKELIYQLVQNINDPNVVTRLLALIAKVSEELN